MTLILDSGALMALERGDRGMWRRLKSSLHREQSPITHGGIIGQAWRKGGTRQALCGRRDVIDAALVLLAIDGDQIVTSAPGDLEPLARVARLNVDVLPI